MKAAEVRKAGSHRLWMGLNTGSDFSAKQLSDRDPSFNPYALYSNNFTPGNLSWKLITGKKFKNLCSRTNSDGNATNATSHRTPD